MQRWRDILIDFIVDLPSSNGFTNIMVVVDRLIKMQHIVPIDSIDAILVAKYFVRYVFKLHRLPNSIVSDYGSQFISDFWQALYKQLDI
jgi:IS30 family transposase